MLSKVGPLARVQAMGNNYFLYVILFVAALAVASHLIGAI